MFLGLCSTLALLQISCIPADGQNIFSSLITRRQTTDAQVPPTPCPSTFQYNYGSNGWYGQISISPALGKDSSGKLIPIYMDVQLALPASLPSRYVGKLQLAETNEMVWQKIRNGNPNNPIMYQVLFPLSYPLPSVLSIGVNRNIICSGTVAQIPGRLMTTINLNHKFFPYSISLNSGGRPNGNTQLQPQIESQNIIRPDESSINNFPISNSESIAFKPQVLPSSTTTTIPPIVYSQQTTPAPVNFNNRPSSSQGSEGKCGKPLTSNFLVVNGEAVTKRGEWPWMVALFHNINDGVGIKYNCGGTLISRYYVLTAAHCIENRGRRLTADQVLLYLGKFNLNKWSEDGAQTSEVKNIYAHPEYKNSADADIAVLELTIRAEYSPYIQPACVWPSHNSALDPVVGKIGVVAGWGLDENNKLSSAVPKTVKMPIVSQEECLRSGQSFTVLTSTRTFCAGYRNGSAPCNGDSGGGFMIPMPDEEWGGTKWFIRGVVSTSLLGSGRVTCDANNFVIFTDIAKHGSWISQFTGV